LRGSGFEEWRDFLELSLPAEEKGDGESNLAEDSLLMSTGFSLSEEQLSSTDLLAAA
jgi:hypothetical protein